MSAVAVAGAEGGPQSLYHSSDDEEETSLLAQLSTMFPTLDHDVILTVLQSHHGQLEAAVDYLVTAAASSVGVVDHTPSQPPAAPLNSLYPAAYDMGGLYSEDIGGMPEVVPTFEGGEGSDSSDGESVCSDHRSLSPSGSVDPEEDDPLPTYEEACMGTDVLPMARYIVDDYSQQSPQHDDGGDGSETSNNGPGQQPEGVESSDNTTQAVEGAQGHCEKKGKRKKLKKLANKLSMRKSKATRQRVEQRRFGSAVPTPSSYRRLVDGMNMEDLYELEGDESEEDRH